MRALASVWAATLFAIVSPVSAQFAAYSDSPFANEFQPVAASNAGAGQYSPGASAPCDCCHCAPCECPLQPAPCQPCPHVSTVLPYWNINIFGALQANMHFSTARMIGPGTPFLLAPGTIADDNTVDVHARSSYLGAVFTGPQIGELQASGMVMAFFYNDAVIVDRYGILPAQAWGDLKNEDWRFAAGLQFDVFCPNMPTMLVWSSLLASGNVGNNFRGQFRVERFLHPTDDSQWTIQAALSEPVATTITNNFNLNEDNGWPNVELRAAWSAGELKQEGLEAKRALEIGASTVFGQLRQFAPLQGNVVADVFGLGTDFRWRINDRWGVVGEAFVGQGLGTYNGGVLQNTNSATFAPIRTTGAWGEVYCYLTPCLHAHGGAAVDNPIDRDLAVGQIERNQTWFANLLWDLNKSLRVGFEVTWRETNYRGLRDNEGAGLHTQVQFAF